MSRAQLLTFSAALALTACNPFHQREKPMTSVSVDENVNARWRAALVTPAALAGAVQIKGTATMQPGKQTNATRMDISVTNATPGGLHPWRVHRGQCGQDEGVFGADKAYHAMQIGADGTGMSSAKVNLTTPDAGRYFVAVMASRANDETVVACGNLAPPA